MNSMNDLPETRSDLVLEASLALLKPLVHFLVEEGVTYNVFSRRLKDLFVAGAIDVLTRRGSKVTDSAVSVLSGLHRKDLRLRTEEKFDFGLRPLSIASQVFTRWATDPRYRDEQGEPLVLPKTGEGVTFEGLATELTKDIHPRSLLESLLSMGLVELVPGGVCLAPGGFVPKSDFKQLLSLFSSNLADHVSASVTNLSHDAPKMLEHSIFADELSEEAVKVLQHKASLLWREVFEQFVPLATEQCEISKDQLGSEHRLRFGVYFYSEPVKDRNDPKGEEHE